jgi:putative FmdB family regulatory protein
MPQYAFECSACNLQFSRNLKMGDHKTHTCPSCKEQASRVWEGQGFGFDFAQTEGTHQANSGVTKHDYPTADVIVGMSAEARWNEIHAREEVKQKVRQATGQRVIRRQDAPDHTYIDYSSVTSEQNEARKRLIEDAKRVEKAVRDGDR